MLAPTILQGDCREVLPTLPDESVHCVVTSPPYYGLRDYGTARWDGGDPWCDHLCPPGGGTQSSGLHYGNSQEAIERKVEIRRQQYRGACVKCGARRQDQQIGLEATPEEHIEALVAVFREARRVLRKDGVCWLNYGDCYASSANGRSAADTKAAGNDDRAFRDKPFSTVGNGYKPKDLMMMPHRVAMALQADGWWVRADCVWSKPNPMPSSATDRPALSHEYVFLLARSERYFYDADAVREPARYGRTIYKHDEPKQGRRDQSSIMYKSVGSASEPITRGAKRPDHSEPEAGRNRRTVWEIATQPTPDAHFATFPEALVKPCILAGTSERGCCAACGAPWVREVEREKAVVKSPNSQYGHQAGRNDGGRSELIGASTTTTGWSPSCTCNAGDPVPCTVLDPFGGSGTVALVASNLGRKSILIELNPKYVTIARKKNQQQCLELL